MTNDKTEISSWRSAAKGTIKMSINNKTMQEASDKSRKNLSSWSQKKPSMDDVTLIITEDAFEDGNLAKESISEEVAELKEKAYGFEGSGEDHSYKKTDTPTDAGKVNEHLSGQPHSVSESSESGVTSEQVNAHAAYSEEAYDKARENVIPPADEAHKIYNK